MTITVKICGITTAEAAEAAGAADLVGFVFYPPSPRAVSPAQAAELSALLPKGVRRVGLFVDPTEAVIAETLALAPLDLLQLHGRETPDRVAALRARFGCQMMKAIKVASAADIDGSQAFAGAADWLLFDAPPPNRPGALPGGNAVSFDWSLLKGRRIPLPWLLSGGLDPTNVRAAIAATGAPGVDVSSGVEDRPGLKSPDKIRAFIAAARG